MILIFYANITGAAERDLGARPSAGDAESGSEAGKPCQRRWAMDGPSARPDGVAPEGGNPQGQARSKRFGYFAMTK